MVSGADIAAAVATTGATGMVDAIAVAGAETGCAPPAMSAPLAEYTPANASNFAFSALARFAVPARTAADEFANNRSLFASL